MALLLNSMSLIFQPNLYFPFKGLLFKWLNLQFPISTHSFDLIGFKFQFNIFSLTNQCQS